MSRCRSCCAELSREWRRRNPEKAAAQRKRRYERHKDRLLAYRQEWAEKNRDSRRESQRRYYEANREKVQAAIRKWHEENPGKRHEIKARRRQRELSQSVNSETVDRGYVIARDKSICHICGGRVPAAEIELDHLIPLSLGGAHSADNLRVSHRTCNRQRGVGRLPAQLLLLG